MSNERLRAAIHQAGIEIEDLARTVEVDPKTVRRWINEGRPPRGLYRTRVARALHRTELELWPEEHLAIEGRDEKPEILAAYAHASDLAATDWRALLKQASQRIDLLDNTLTDILSAAGTLDLLAAKRDADVQIRVLIAAPDSGHLTINDAENRAGTTLLDVPPSALDAAESLRLLRPLLADNLKVRTFVAPRPNTILRFDNELLLTLQLHAVEPEQAPLMHLQRHSDHGLFQQLADHYDKLWQTAQPLTPAATV